MKLIIDIPYEAYYTFKCNLEKGNLNALGEIIANGIPYDERSQGEILIKCKECKYQVREWREDKRMKEKGYWVYGCEHFGEIMGYWGFGGNDNEFCSDAEQKGGAE